MRRDKYVMQCTWEYKLRENMEKCWKIKKKYLRKTHVPDRET